MSQKRLIKLALVAASPIFRTGLRKLLSLNSGFTVVGEAGDFQTAIANSEKEKPDIILLDSSNESEIDLLDETKQIPPIAVIILTESNLTNLSPRFFEVGIRGAVSKECGSAVLFKAIKKVYEGEFWFERSLMAQVIRDLVEEKKAFYAKPEFYKIAALTAREKEVITLVGQGLKNKEIAEQLFISENTVRHHLGSIFEKLEVSGRLELIIYAYKHNLVKLS